MADSDPSVPLVSLVLFIACGAMVFVIIFLFAKRQISRLALKSRRLPHAPIGTNAPKDMKKRIQEKLKRTSDIKFEPKLMTEKLEEQFDSKTDDGNHFIYRMKAMDSVKELDKEFKKKNITRKPGDDMHIFFHQSFKGSVPEVVIQFADMYKQARNHPKEFGKEEFDQFSDLLQQVIKCVQETHLESRVSSSKVKSKSKHESKAAKDTHSADQVTYIPPPNGSKTGMYRLLTQRSSKDSDLSSHHSGQSDTSSVQCETTL